MNEARLDPQQPSARAELLLAADFGHDARGRPIHGRLESEDGGGEPGPMLKLGAVRTRRLAVSEGTDRPSGSACGNPLRGTRESASTVPIGAPLVVRTDVLDARGWRVYRVAPNGAVIYDRWIEHDPARAELALTELRAAAAASPAAALRRAVERRPGHAGRGSNHAVARRPGDRAVERPGEAPVADGTAAVAAPSLREAAAHDALAGNRDALQLMPTVARGCSGPARQTTTTPAEGRRGAVPTPCTGTPRTTPTSRPS